MDLSGDDLAGVVDLFGGLTRAELDEAVEELAFKRRDDIDSETVGAAIDEAVDSYHLVAVPDGTDGGDSLLVAGPASFPQLPDGAEDLPHIMDVPDRTVDRGRAAEAARDHLVADAEAAVEEGEAERAVALVDVSYDLETWGPVDASDVRDRLDDA